ncbi:unnamed protein product [Kuraishia capsulata CBS 1993]|uniref:Large ribosomal subunit protein uL11m n=1 Tax=Kuraishia capsulata CBS 1993 TaxID=1382522 RepID=W6MU22_9ASCO|nr:uncharacterized protein KUCA_T00004812001 [Kuraishia capsulata CBS 1993]CDK28827.1 unnamed protein product [Kuraishia capsulata CBS 1993]
MSGKTALVKLIVPAGKAAATPPVGPALGSKGVKAIDFCKEFNARTQIYKPGTPIPALVKVNPDRTFTFDIKSPSTVWLLMQAAGISKGSAENKKPVATLSLKHVYEIAKIKKGDFRHQHMDLEVIARNVLGTAKTIGIDVVA